MKLQSRSREEPEINVISLVDVLLVLVLFFMVSTSFLRETEISVTLPEADVDSLLHGLDHNLDPDVEIVWRNDLSMKVLAAAPGAQPGDGDADG